MYACEILQLAVFLIGNRFEPLVGGFLARTFYCEVAEPAVGLCAVPVLYACGDSHYIADRKALCRLALFLIPAAAVNADKELSAAALCVVDMPVIAA